MLIFGQNKEFQCLKILQKMSHLQVPDTGYGV